MCLAFISLSKSLIIIICLKNEFSENETLFFLICGKYIIHCFTYFFWMRMHIFSKRWNNIYCFVIQDW